MRKDLVLVALLVTILALMAVPISQTFIDVLLSINISLSIILLMVAIYIKRPSNFSTFPSVILIGTAFRLALSIATTRLILSEADAGQIIETFGDFVVAGSVGIGLVIFLIITVVQFLVITKGAERVAEVGARFALDAMPGKQMTIDAEARAENISTEEAQAQRASLDKDSQFFGAMDGAMKFVKGDAIAGLIIICINLIGGVIVGISVHDFNFAESVAVFSLLTIGDGLVAQFPALLMSLCAGIMVTRVTKGDAQDLGTEIVHEMVSDARVPAVASLIVFGVGLVPGFPTLIFSAIAAAMILTALSLRRRLRLQEAIDSEMETNDELDEEAMPVEDYRKLDLSDRFIVALSPSCSDRIDTEILEKKLGEQHWNFFTNRGVQFPRTNIRLDDLEVPDDEIIVLLDEVPLATLVFPQDMLFIQESDAHLISSQFKDIELFQFECKLYAGKWIDEKYADQIDGIGIKAVSQVDLLASIAFRFYESNVGPLFTNAVLRSLVEALRIEDAEIMAEIEAEMNLPALLKTFRYLVEDGVPLRPASLLLSSLHYWINNIDEPTSVSVAEGLRSAMKRQLCHSIAGNAGVLGLSLVDPGLEQHIRKCLSEVKRVTDDPAFDGLYFQPDVHDRLIERFGNIHRSGNLDEYQTTIVVSADLRRRLRNYLAVNGIQLPVLAPHEIANDLPSFPLEIIDIESSDISRLPKKATAH